MAGRMQRASGPLERPTRTDRRPNGIMRAARKHSETVSVFGAESEQALESACRLGALCLQHHMPQLAVEAFHTASSIYKARVPIEHGDATDSLRSADFAPRQVLQQAERILVGLAQSHAALGRSSKAMYYYQQALQVIRRLGPYHTHAWRVVQAMAVLYQREERMADALLMRRRERKLLEAILPHAQPGGVDWTDLVACCEATASLLQRNGDIAAAAAVYVDDVCPELEEQLGLSHKQTILAYLHTAHLLMQHHMYRQAQSMLSFIAPYAREHEHSDVSRQLDLMARTLASLHAAQRYLDEHSEHALEPGVVVARAAADDCYSSEPSVSGLRRQHCTQTSNKSTSRPQQQQHHNEAWCLRSEPDVTPLPSHPLP